MVECVRSGTCSLSEHVAGDVFAKTVFLNISGDEMKVFEALRSEYAELWATMELRANMLPAVTATARKIISGREKYSAVERVTGVPWWIVGTIHAMECGLKWDRHLHNGDPLTARTRLVPAGRPKSGKPPYTWHESACDALLMKGFDKVPVWDMPRVCYELERYNGWGYRNFHPETLSPYLWSGTTHYTRGKYVADHVWSATAVSGQSGALALIKRIAELEPSVQLDAPEQDPADAFHKTPDAETPTKRPVLPTIKQSKSLWTILTALGVKITETLSEWLGLLPDVQTEAAKSIDPLTSLGGWMGANMAWISSVVVLAAFAIVFVRHLNDKRAMP